MPPTLFWISRGICPLFPTAPHASGKIDKEREIMEEEKKILKKWSKEDKER